MTAIRFSVDTSISPDRILAAATNFTDGRPDLWPNISRKFYKINSVGDTWADVTEGSDVAGGIWARERYDWSTPGMVRGTCQDSNVFLPGGIWEMTVRPAEGGGSHIEVVRDRKGKGLKGKLLEAMLAVMGRKTLKQGFQQTLDILGDNPASSVQSAQIR